MIEGNVFQNPDPHLLQLITRLGDSFASLRRRTASDRSFSGSLTPLICLAECRTAMSQTAKRASNAQSNSRRITDCGVYIDWGIYIGVACRQGPTEHLPV
jgi:hypothetical protein